MLHLVNKSNFTHSLFSLLLSKPRLNEGTSMEKWLTSEWLNTIALTDCSTIDVIYTTHQKKKVTHLNIFRWTVFSSDYGTHSPWHRLDKLLHCHNIYLQRSYRDDGRVGPLCRVFSSTSQRFSMGLRSALEVLTLQSMCDTDVSCSLNHSFSIWAQWNQEYGRKKSTDGTTWSFSIFR